MAIFLKRILPLEVSYEKDAEGTTLVQWQIITSNHKISSTNRRT